MYNKIVVAVNHPNCRHFEFGFGCKLELEKVIFHDPATIVYWTDGTRTVVKTHNESYDKEKGLAMAVAKKMLGKDYKLIRELCKGELK